jgi:hypothetical protein
MRPPDVARAMGLPLRSYERFEAGAGRMDWSRILAFAEATRSDPLAIFIAVLGGIPNLAVHCADNKLPSLWQLALEEFHAGTDDGVRALDAAFILEVFEDAFRTLAAEARRRGAIGEGSDGSGNRSPPG